MDIPASRSASITPGVNPGEKQVDGKPGQESPVKVAHDEANKVNDDSSTKDVTKPLEDNPEQLKKTEKSKPTDKNEAKRQDRRTVAALEFEVHCTALIKVALADKAISEESAAKLEKLVKDLRDKIIRGEPIGASGSRRGRRPIPATNNLQPGTGADITQPILSNGTPIVSAGSGADDNRQVPSDADNGVDGDDSKQAADRSNVTSPPGLNIAENDSASPDNSNVQAKTSPATVDQDLKEDKAVAKVIRDIHTEAEKVEQKLEMMDSKDGASPQVASSDSSSPIKQPVFLVNTQEQERIKAAEQKQLEKEAEELLDKSLETSTSAGNIKGTELKDERRLLGELEESLNRAEQTTRAGETRFDNSRDPEKISSDDTKLRGRPLSRKFANNGRAVRHRADAVNRELKEKLQQKTNEGRGVENRATTAVTHADLAEMTEALNRKPDELKTLEKKSDEARQRLNDSMNMPTLGRPKDSNKPNNIDASGTQIFE